jgi:hypothetical protein
MLRRIKNDGYTTAQVCQAVLWIRITLRADPDPDPVCHFDVDPNPDSSCHFDADADPDPIFHFDADLASK